MAERDDAPLANDQAPGVPPNDSPTAPLGPEDENAAPSGLPEGEEDSEPLGGVEHPDPDGEGEPARGEDAQPGINRGEPDVSG